jgi:WD40 repeat protein
MTLLAADPQGAHLAIGGQHQQIQIVSTATGRTLSTLQSPFPWVTALRWSACGEMLASAAGKTVSVWRNGSEEVRFDDHASTVADLAWVDREELVSTCYGQVTFWSRVNPKSPTRYLWKGSLLNLALSGDSEIVACGSQDKTVHFWRRSTGKDSAMSGFESKPTALAFSPSNRFLATNGAPEISIWDFSGSGPEGTAPRQLTLHPSSATSLCFGHTADVLASGCRDGLLAHWIVPPLKGEAIIGWAKLPGQIEKIAWNGDDSLLACTDSDLGLTLWQTAAPVKRRGDLTPVF